jgi:hypothetical protein
MGHPCARILFRWDAKKDALLTATEGFEPSASGNLPSGQQGVSASFCLLACIIPQYVAKKVTNGSQLGKELG